MSVNRADHECVLSLMRQRLGAEAAPQWPCAGAAAEGIVAFASAHFVLPALHAPAVALAAPVPTDLLEFLAEIERSNRARNLVLRDALARIAGALAAIDVVPLVMKGGAFLADAGAGDPAWRFMSDLDLLVDPAKLDACVGAVRALGYIPSEADYDPQREAHFPPLVSPCGTYCIELHTRLFAVHAIAIDSATLFADAMAITLGGASLLLPSPTHRVVHLIAHAQLHNRFHLMRRVVLRDHLDLGTLTATHGHVIDWAQVLSAFALGRDRDAALAFVAAHQDVTRRALPMQLGPRHRRWAKASLVRLGHPGWRRRIQLAADALRAEAVRTATEPHHLRRRLALLEPGLLRRVIAKRRYKTTQKLWA